MLSEITPHIAILDAAKYERRKRLDFRMNTMTDTTNHFRDLLNPVSRARYVSWRILGARNPIAVRLKSGLRLTIRSGSTTDYGVAFDVFWRGCYRCPEPVSHVKRIVDLGANVGYSCLFWCQQYPEASVTAFEPHPKHLSAIAGHLSANHFSDRVKVVQAAAGVAEAEAHLTDAGSSSAITNSTTGYAVPVVDVFQMLDGTIDILKIDIEGGEYGLLGDERFGSLRVRTVVVEWHKTSDCEDGRAWCQERLEQFGYRTTRGIEDLPLAGLIWGFKLD
jgi:FkbM family methyltransferase